MALDFPEVTTNTVVKTIVRDQLTLVIILHDEYVEVLSIEPDPGAEVERKVTNHKRLTYTQWADCMGIEGLLEWSMEAKRL